MLAQLQSSSILASRGIVYLEQPRDQAIREFRSRAPKALLSWTDSFVILRNPIGIRLCSTTANKELGSRYPNRLNGIQRYNFIPPLRCDLEQNHERRNVTWPPVSIETGRIGVSGISKAIGFFVCRIDGAMFPGFYRFRQNLCQ